MSKRIDTAVILAAGKGTRLRPYTHDIPKGFMQVGEEKLIERSIRLLKKNGIENIIIGTGHLHEQYEKLAEAEGLKTFLSPDFAITGSFHTLCYGQELINSDFLLLESDLLFEELAITELLMSKNNDIILCSGFTQSNDEVYVSEQDGLLKKLSKQKEELDTINAELVGIWKVSQKLYQQLLALHSSTPDSKNMDYELAIANLCSKGYHVNVLTCENLIWCEIDNEEHLERAYYDVLPRL
ncbi:phosphocholine cytidylyltransferase family protein [Reichenbachiella ulvae]|uniref:Phosphocholine cytidylyltransferase family protein n=1 Tax=Reichenbachiella ulvae TaxID=2980104 RepID=A0ABT3CUU0_9BACT|nr:phosphocholine cytidylyltransferase family protein [Reichenbachiella ulvae]MCV9387240.1 phosphocholine cytidylyltransferase family protein [Reichenbachiella ulvae]